ncbi:TIGR01457 family HAD-type hydrolase [Viridibacillus sp. YIM B01967]|uniref:TIGR01457 family HAD-type hydrolase n=1 Tax=Viridibacillus soli TaxID=2798301 RepID=A0ABS1H9S0_9BACL|nr:TIGR01457 family HAD-type hydrolase [Viridibacillus soli]MBK3496164.1 TIGR01457 family HAD-type hydrolase [Viridibacillus soli]
MKAYKAYCFDLDGTVYKGSEPIPSAVTFIHELQKNGVEPFFVTNNARMTQRQAQQKLQKMGIVTSEAHILTSAIAAAKYVSKHYPNATVQMIGEEGLKAALLAENIRITKEQPDVLVQGIDLEINYSKIENACYVVQNGAQFIATNGDLKFPNEKGFAPGNGSIAELIHTVTGVAPTYIGKPQPHMLAILQQLHGLEKEDMLMIGDNYDTDILAGINFGIDTLHVNTGVTPTDLVLKKAQKPTFTVNSLLDWL